jgi:hypothetical protein
VTTPKEHLVADLRNWLLWTSNWDGEGAKAPDAAAIGYAVNFVFGLDARIPMPEPMLFPSGNAGLFWETDQIYADLEFFGDGRLTYFVKRPEGRHKGVVKYEGKNIPEFVIRLLS